MAPERKRYRKLPGHRRGILRGATLWLGSDHLLSVKSLRFREEYKRFHLRDVQAIVVARAPCFHLSTRAMGLACLWFAVFLATRGQPPNLQAWITPALSGAGAGLLFAWLYVSFERSCRCRIYTAVSRDDLPSIYRTWTARKFLAAVEPLIAQVQGVVAGDWAEAIEDRDVGPPGTDVAIPRRGPAATGGDDGPSGDAREPSYARAPSGDARSLNHPVARSRTMASDIFVASLFAGALLSLFTLHSMTRAIQSIEYGLAFVQVGGAIVIFVQHHRGILKAGMRKLAIATLIAMGGAYYLRQVMAGIYTASRPGLPDLAVLTGMHGYILLREVDAAVCLVLGVVGVALALLARDDLEAPRSIAG